MSEEEKKLFEQMILLSSSDDEESLNFFIDTHKELLKVDPISFIGLHVSFYSNKEDPIKALQVVEYYKSLPYISMEVEDLLNELRDELNKLLAPKKVEFSIEELKKFMYSKNENSVVSALHHLSKMNIRNHLDVMKEYLVSDVSYKYKALALFILIEQHIDEELLLKKEGLEYLIKPSEMSLPFDDFDYLDVKGEIEKVDEGSDVISVAIEVLNTIQIKNYPDSLLDIDNIPLARDIFIEVAKEFLGQMIDINKLASQYEVNENVDLSNIKKGIVYHVNAGISSPETHKQIKEILGE